jgi:hypothetical protein
LWQIVIDTIVEQGRVRFTRWGYRCRACGNNLSWDMTSPVYQCPKCGNVINDKMSYYAARVARAVGSAFAVAMVIGILEYLYAPYNANARYPFPYVAMAIFVLVTGVLLYKQYWSLLIKRILYRAYAIFFIVAVIIAIPSFILDGLNIYKPDGPLMAAAIVMVSLVLTLVSLVMLKVDTDTLDYDA